MKRTCNLGYFYTMFFMDPISPKAKMINEKNGTHPKIHHLNLDTSINTLKQKVTHLNSNYLSSSINDKYQYC